MYIPGGTTGLFQPCDVGIQRIIKHSFKRSFHEDIVDEVSSQLDNVEEGEEARIVIEKGLPILRDRTVKWLWDAYKTVEKKEIVKQVGIAICAALS